jgi:tripartite-type tricarboxylate transporter receptor subunit TctC
MIRRLLSPLLAATLMVALPATAPAQNFPGKAVKLVVPATAGGATDAFARSLGARLAESWGQPVLVENRPGANQAMGSDYVSKAAPDGYTLLVSEASSFIMNPHLYKKLPYDWFNGFTPITGLVNFPWVLAVNAAVPANSFQELLALAKQKPGTLSYGSFGNGSASHIAVDYLKKITGADILQVPYKGAAPGVTDLLSGQISMMVVTPLLVEPHARTGKLRLIAATTAQRIPQLPSLPTIAESGVPGYVAGTWMAFMGPPGMARDLVLRINADTLKILNDPVFREQSVNKQWFQVIGGSPEEFAEYLKAEYQRWGELIKVSGVSVE